MADAISRLRPPRDESDDDDNNEEELRYVVELSKWTKEQVVELRAAGFSLINNKWQREEELSDEEWCDLEDLGYIISEA
jgi:hypothetical protein